MLNPKRTALFAGASLRTALAMAGLLATPWTVTAAAAQAEQQIGERVIEDGGTGPYKAIMVGHSSLPTHTIFRPKDLSAFGGRVKLPILAWGNGGCATSPAAHQNYLSEIASHGFLIVAIGPPPAAGGGRGGGGGDRSNSLLAAVDWAIAQNGDNASAYKDKLDVSKVAVFGHSCGGLQALEVSGDPRISTTIVANSGILNAGFAPGGRGNPGGGAPGAAPPAGAGAPGGAPAGGGARGGGLPGMPPLTKEHLTKLHAPVFYLLGGEKDIAYANGMDDFKRIEKVPVFLANKDVGHGGTFNQPHGSDWAMVSVAWLKWQLKGDADAGKLFTGNPPGLATIAGWTVDKKNIR
jgi:hypothetical protein